MSEVLYKCPGCDKWQKMRGVHYAGSRQHKCRLCGSKNNVKSTTTTKEMVDYRAYATLIATDPK